MPLDPAVLTPGQKCAKKDFGIAYFSAAWYIVMGQWLLFVTKDNAKGYRNELQTDGMVYEISDKAAGERVPANAPRPCYAHVLYRIKRTDAFTYLGIAQKIT